jgi:hypothetical protein
MTPSFGRKERCQERECGLAAVGAHTSTVNQQIEITNHVVKVAMT